MMKLKILIAVPIILVMFIVGCQKFELIRLAKIETGEPTNVTYTTVDIEGILIDLGIDGEVEEYGFCLSYINKPPRIDDKAIPPFDPRDNTGDFSSHITGLTEGEVYQIRAYLVENSGDVTYGEVKSFTTLQNINIPTIVTANVINISQTAATGGGNVTDGGGSTVTSRGVCWSLNTNPTLSNNYTTNGTGTGNFSSQITGLNPGTTYYVRAYATNSDGTSYGNQVSFQTMTGSSGFWLHYDSGNNDDNGVGLTEGGTFDIAIRFPTEALSQYHGFKVTKIRFFPRAYEPEYHITLWEGSNPPTLLDVQQVYPTIDQWNEFEPDYDYYINSTKEFWAGIWIVNHDAGTYPAGVDEGPAVTGKGDMISFDDGDTWEALSISNPDLDYNWNLQVYVSNQKGEEIQMVNEYSIETKEKKVSTTNSSNKVSTAKMNK